jgi:hypothetical protein
MDRFEVLTAEEVAERQLDPDGEWVWSPETDYTGYLYDSQNNRIVASDAGEPEDADFGRDLKVFVDLLNEVAKGG